MHFGDIKYVALCTFILFQSDHETCSYCNMLCINNAFDINCFSISCRIFFSKIVAPFTAFAKVLFYIKNIQMVA